MSPLTLLQLGLNGYHFIICLMEEQSTLKSRSPSPRSPKLSPLTDLKPSEVKTVAQARAILMTPIPKLKYHRSLKGKPDGLQRHIRQSVGDVRDEEFRRYIEHIESDVYRVATDLLEIHRVLEGLVDGVLYEIHEESIPMEYGKKKETISDPNLTSTPEWREKERNRYIHNLKRKYNYDYGKAYSIAIRKYPK